MWLQASAKLLLIFTFLQASAVFGQYALKVGDEGCQQNPVFQSLIQSQLNCRWQPVQVLVMLEYLITG
jgi:hypothetical protein